MPVISVIIPAYNAVKYLAEAIESALAQTRPAKEIIVVDDASTDRTVEIARSFGDRVTVLQNAVNSGPGHSRNVGVAASTGEYLAFLDADDKWLPEHLEDLAGLLDQWPEAARWESTILPKPKPFNYEIRERDWNPARRME
jgi:glycosyltransferase involved in cell wall biosynthesis